MRAEDLCMGCMELSGGALACPACNWREGTLPDSPLHLAPRTVLMEQYVLGRVLGHGGFGITYLAWDLNLECKLAVKEYLPSGVATRTSGQTTVAPYSGQSKKDFDWGLEKFLEEARVLARFKQNPGIASVLNFFRAHGTAYLVMEYLEGITLAEYLEQAGGRIPYMRALSLTLPVMDALREVHRAGILHRDISPDNIYVTQSGAVKVLDFGAARYALGQQSRNLSVILKEGYAPEEQYRTKGNQGPWTDVYATAATLYRAISGQVPSPALDRLEKDDLAPPSALGAIIPPDSELCLMKALAVRSSDRYQSMEDFQQAMSGGGRTRKLTRSLVAERDPAPHTLDRDLAPPMPGPAPPPASAPSLLAAVAEQWRRSRPLRAALAAQLLALWRRTPKQIAIGVAALIVLLGVWAIERKPNGEDANKSATRAGDEGAPTPNPRGTTPQPAGTSPQPPAGESTQPPGAIAVNDFAADPPSIRPGRRATIRWNVSGAKEVTINGNPVPPQGKFEVKSQGTQEYKLVAKAADGSVEERSVTLQVEPPNDSGAPGAGETVAVQQFSVLPAQIRPGQMAYIMWSVSGATRVEIQPDVGRVTPGSNRTVVRPRSTQTYYLVAEGPGGPVRRNVTLTVVGASFQPRIVSFGARPTRIRAGQPATLSWSVTDARVVELLPNFGTVESSGQRVVSPTRSIVYTLVARPDSGPPARQAVTVDVVAAGQSGVPQPDQAAGAPPQDLTPPQPGSVPAAGSQARPVSFSVIHDHRSLSGVGVSGLGNPGARNLSPSDFCAGQLSLQGGHISFQSFNPGHSFNLPLTQIAEVRANRLPIHGYAAFHVRFSSGQNYNFGAVSVDASSVVNAIQEAMAARE